jgi:hypothetical protein
VLSGERRKFYDKLRDLCSSHSTDLIIKSMRLSWATHVVEMREIRKSCRISSWKPLVKWTFERSRRRRKDNIMRGPKDTGSPCGDRGKE